MKKILYLAFTLVAFVFACKKNNGVTEPKKSQNQSSLVFFVDTFRVYNSDLEGNGLKVSVNEDENSGNNYIAYIAYSKSKKFVYSYKPASGNSQIKVANADGSDRKILKTLSNNVNIDFLGSFGDKILYTSTTNTGPTLSTTVRTMSEDGSNDILLNTPAPNLAARNGSTFVSTTEDYSSTTPSTNFYVVKFKNGTWDEASSFNIPKVTNILRASAISDDGNTLVYVTSSDYSTLTYDVYTIDISKKNNTAKKILSHTLPSTGEGAVQYPPFISVALANGSSNVIVGYGVNVKNQRYATPDDYYYIQNFDITKNMFIKKWKITGEYDGKIIVN